MTTQRMAVWALAALVSFIGVHARAADPDRGGDVEEASKSGKADPDEPGKLTLIFTDFRNDEGQALVALFRGAEGFPNDVDKATFSKAYPIEGRRLKVEIDDVPPGELAVAIHHDEDADFEMDTRVFGIPKEGYGASRDAKARFGPPKYEDARFNLAPGRHLRLRIQVRYF